MPCSICKRTKVAIGVCKKCGIDVCFNTCLLWDNIYRNSVWHQTCIECCSLERLNVKDYNEKLQLISNIKNKAKL